MLELLDEEDEEQRAKPQFSSPQHAEAFEHLHAAIQACDEAREQAELTRLFVMSEHRNRDE
jgi:hypothetical protein